MEEEDEPAVEVSMLGTALGGEPSLHDPLASPPPSPVPQKETPPPARVPSRVPTILKSVPVPPIPPKYASMTESEFTGEMAQSIFGIVLESVALFQKDPREYHPFYLRVYKYLTIGQRLGFLSKEPEEANRLWTEFSDYARRQYEKGRQTRPTFMGEKSPYAYFMQNRKVMIDGKLVPPPWTEREKNNRFSRLDRLVEKMRREWQDTRGKEGGSIKEDLELRLGFLKECMGICYPGYTVRMNNLWSVLLQEPPQRKMTLRNMAAVEKEVVVPQKGGDNKEVKRIVVKVIVPRVEEEEVKLESTEVHLPASLFGADSPAPSPETPDDEASPCEAHLPTSAEASKDDNVEVPKATPPVIVLLPRKRIKRRKHFPPKPVTAQNVAVVQKKKMVSRLLKPKKTIVGAKRQLLVENLICKRALPQPKPKVKSKPQDKPVIVAAEVPTTEEVDIPPAPVVDEPIPEPKIVAQAPEMPNPAPLPNKTVRVPKRKKAVVPKTKPLLGNQRKKKALAQLNRAESQKERQMKVEMRIAKMSSRKVQDLPSPAPASPLPSAPSSPFPSPPNSPLPSAPNSPCPASPPASPQQPESPSPVTPAAVESDLVKCDECDKEYASDYLPVHQKMAHSQGVNRCVVCDETFNGARKLWNHFSRFHLRDYDLGSLDPATQVPLPPRFRKQKTPALSTTATATAAVFTCEHCGKQLSTSKNLERHIHATHTDPEILAQHKLLCPHCPTQFKFKDALNFHVRKQHEKSVNSRCPHCSKDCNTSGKLWLHMIDAHDISVSEATDFCQVKTAQCCYCGQHLLEDSRNQRNHVSSQHPDQLAEFLAQEATRRLLNKTVNRNARDYKDEYQKRNHRLRTERRRAKSLQSTECPECGETFHINKISFHRRRTHGVLSEENVPCPECELSCNTRTALRFHLRCQHTTPLERFIEDRGLVTQVERQGHGLVVYKCTQCDVYLRGIVEAKIHVVAKHKEAVLQAAENWDGAEKGEEMPERILPKKRQRQLTGIEYKSTRELEMQFQKLPLKCALCARIVKVCSINRHLKEVHRVVEDGNMLQCGACGKRLRKRSTYLAHLKMQHELQLDMDAELERLGKPNTIADPRTLPTTRLGIARKPQVKGNRVQCPLCPKLFTQKYARDFHVKKCHENSVNSRCPHCHKDMSTPGKLWIHLVNEHSIPVEEATEHCQVKTTQCPYCEKPLLADARHQRKHVADQHPDNLEEFLKKWEKKKVVTPREQNRGGGRRRRGRAPKRKASSDSESEEEEEEDQDEVPLRMRVVGTRTSGRLRKANSGPNVEIERENKLVICLTRLTPQELSHWLGQSDTKLFDKVDEDD